MVGGVTVAVVLSSPAGVSVSGRDNGHATRQRRRSAGGRFGGASKASGL